MEMENCQPDLLIKIIILLDLVGDCSKVPGHFKRFKKASHFEWPGTWAPRLNGEIATAHETFSNSDFTCAWQ